MLFRYKLSLVTIVWVLPSATSNHAKVPMITQADKICFLQRNISDFLEGMTETKSVRLSVGFNLWMFTQNYKLLLFYRHIFLMKRRPTFWVGDSLCIYHQLWAQKKTFLPKWPKQPTHQGSSEWLQMLQLFLFVLTAKAGGEWNVSNSKWWRSCSWADLINSLPSFSVNCLRVNTMLPVISFSWVLFGRSGWSSGGRGDGWCLATAPTTSTLSKNYISMVTCWESLPDFFFF